MIEHKSFKELIELETKPKHKTFFGKIFDSKEIAKKVSIHTLPQYKLFCGVEKQTDKGLYIPELSRVWEGHSLLANWYNQLRSVTFAVNGNDGTTWDDGYINYKDTSDVVTSQNYPITWHSGTSNQYVIAAADGTLGILLGTGTTAVTERQNELTTPMTHAVGGGATTLNYGATTANVTYDSVNKIWQIDLSRLFTGNGTSTVTVAEMGLVFNAYDTKKIMTARDLVSPTEDIAVSPATATFHYILQQVNPA